MRVQDATGAPLAGVEVTVEQTRHAVGFGCTGFDLVATANGETGAAPDSPFGGAADASRLEQAWFDLFDTATLPFYWGGFEPVRGEPDTARMLTAARYFVERGARVKGHPLLWHTVTADWLRELGTDEVEAAQRARIRREVAGFAGLVDSWDVVNEAVIMPVFTNEEHRNGITRLCWERGRIATVRMAFEEARAADPTATLLINDFDLGTAYECLLEGVLEAGVPVDAIGLQSHMHQGWWGEERTLAVLDRFARFGLPLHLTETTLLSGELMPADVEDLNDHRPPSWPSTPEGEQRQAEEVVRHYRTLLSHPAVASVTYWGLTDDGAWLGAPAGLLRADGTPKPAYDALRGLVRGEWWLAPTTLRTDDDGTVAVDAWLGEHRLSRAGTSATFSLTEPGTTAVTVVLPDGPPAAEVR